MKKRSFLIWGMVFLAMLSCQKQQSVVKNGLWKGELAVAENRWAPFLFDVENAGTDSAVVTLINGEERVRLDNARFRSDTLVIPIAAYDAYIEGVPNGDTIYGKFVKNYIAQDEGVPFRAFFGVDARFPVPSSRPAAKIDGRWDLLFIGEEGDTAWNVGLFRSEGDKVSGSVLTRAGDLRFLEGSYTSEGVVLSAFGGLSPYLLVLDFSGDSTLNGQFFTTRGVTEIKGSRNDHAALEDPYSVARLKKGYRSLGFRLPSIDGDTVSLADPRYQDKVVIVSILGSWCPNCLDEMAFLAPWYELNRNRGVEVIGIAFERKDDFDYAKQSLTRLRDRYHTGYPLLFGGQVSRLQVDKVFPEVENFSGYPTTFFIDKKGTVRKIHTGFNGPATGLFYEEFKGDFNLLVDTLLSE